MFNLSKLTPQPLKWFLRISGIVVVLALLTLSTFLYSQHISQVQEASLTSTYDNQKQVLKSQLDKLQHDLQTLQNEDQVVKNNKLQAEINSIHTDYKKTVSLYEQILDLKVNPKSNTSNLDTLFTQALSDLSDQSYASAEGVLSTLDTQIKKENDRLAALLPTPAPAKPKSTPTPVVVNNTLPGAGYHRQSVQSSNGTFQVDIIGADLTKTKVIVDTASSSDCFNNCPVLPLSTYISRNNAIAGINGNYFCPASYPSCAGKTNSFDMLVMNKNKYIFNGPTNVASTLPLAVLTGSTMQIISQTRDWNRDTSADSAIANYPLLVKDGQKVFTSTSDPKMTSRGTRTFLANKGNIIYIGIVYNANMYDSAAVMSSLKVDNALNLDEGGSTALWYGGNYLAGPGRNIPDAVLFVNR